MDSPLSDVRVVEVTNFVAAPSAGAVLADLGAEVVKIEPLRGDSWRGMTRPPKATPGMPGLDYGFQVDNRGKRSVAIALDQPEGAELVRRLVAGVDVFLCNLLPYRQQRFGLDWPTLRTVNPRLVHATFTGYGMTGPDVMRPGYDVTAFFGRGSVLDAMTEPGGVAPMPRPAQGDHTAGLALALGILAALRLAERTGEGQAVDASLLGTAVWTMATDLSAVLIDGREPTKRDRHHLISPLANRFLCGDGRWILLTMPELHWWPRFCEAFGHLEWITDARFDTMKNRFDNMPDLIDLMDAEFATRPRDEWGRLFDEAGLIWGPASTLSELATDPQAEAAGLFPDIDHPAGRFRTVAVPIHIDGAGIRPRGPAPDIGQHTEEVLEAAGLTPGEVAALAAAGIVGPCTLDEPDAVDVDVTIAEPARPSGSGGHRAQRTPRASRSTRATTTAETLQRTRR
jgi:crotonobetainyl-CoA:carnitine CoA-transferase CaiB-like acyl-CoA transferase